MIHDQITSMLLVTIMNYPSGKSASNSHIPCFMLEPPTEVNTWRDLKGF
jgi:hypothetical protein